MKDKEMKLKMLRDLVSLQEIKKRTMLVLLILLLNRFI